jgi:hypothetical protein
MRVKRYQKKKKATSTLLKFSDRLLSSLTLWMLSHFIETIVEKVKRYL